MVRKRKHVVYYALDVCPSTLAASLTQLRSALEHSPYVTCRPLCMTYRDGISWLAKEPSLAGKHVSVLWLGSSFANESPDDFGQLLGGISSARAAKNSSPASRIARLQLLVSADGTKDPATVSRAYDSRDGLSRAFVLNVLHNANRSLGRRVFDTDNWCFDGAWDAGEAQFQTCIRAMEDQAVKIAGEEVLIRKGEKIKVITSRKLGPDDVEAWLAGTGFTVNSTWKHPRFDYGELFSHYYYFPIFGSDG